MVEENEKFILADTELTLNLYKSECFDKYEFHDNEEVMNFKRYVLDSMLVKDLRALCNTHKLRPATKKQALIDQLIESNISVDELPLPIIPNSNFQNLIKNSAICT